MSRTVLFAGGPLHGQILTVHSTAGVYAMPEVMPQLSATVPQWTMPEPVLYQMGRFAICGRIVWIGYLGNSPDDDLLFEVLTSDGAKAASVVADRESV